jgi:transposase-like protein
MSLASSGQALQAARVTRVALHWLAVERATSESRSRRFSTKEKTKAVLRLLKGENTSDVARELGTSPERLARWQQTFVDAGEAELDKKKSRLHSTLLWKHRKRVMQWAGVIVVLVVTVFFLTRFFESGGAAAAP